VGKYPWLAAVILFGIVYLVVGVAFPNPSAPSEAQFMWRLAAWLICGVAFAIHIAYERIGLRNSPRTTALHVAMAVALGAFGLAVAANIHSLTGGIGNRRLLGLALVLWPIMTAVPAFLVALVAAAGHALVQLRRARERT
jgi:phosphoglycerol transferase MdoB-like AlkP superfamily enzyme